MRIESPYLPLVRINAPEFYQDEEFVAWLNSTQTQKASWHKPGEPPTEYSDIFMTVTGYEGSDSDMPTHIWDKITWAVAETLGPDTECLVWLSNLQEDDGQEIRAQDAAREASAGVRTEHGE